ncbi:MAG: transposase, partial [Moorea sp. SIO2I5]|nr:transposase [Moorena sp. SIO2I5]
SIERLARQEGMEEGILQSSRENVLEVLQVRFEDLPRELVETINQIESVSVLKTLLRQGITIVSVEEFQGCLDQLLSLEQEQEEG